MTYAQLELSPQEGAYLSEVQDYARVGAPRYFTVADLPSLLDNGILAFTLPGFSVSTYTARSSYFQQDDASTYSWAGSISGAGNGNIILAYAPDGVSGTIQLSARTFALYSLGGARAVMIETGTDAGECGITEETAAPGSTDYCDETFNTCPAVIDVLCVSTNVAYEFSKTSALRLAEANMNLALQNSAVFNKRIRMRYVAAGFTMNFSPIIDDDLTMLENHAAFQDLRDEYRADVILVINEQVYTGAGGGQIFGAVPGDAVHINPDLAFGIVNYHFLNAPRFTFAHEVAHIMGARHNRPDNGGDDETFDCSHGFRFNDADGIERRTILALAPLNGQRILHYSNPDVAFNGAATGSAGNWNAANNNARKMRNTGCTVANFRQDAWLSVIVYKLNDCAFGADIRPPAPGFPGAGPYTIQWRIRTGNPFFTGNEPVISTNTYVVLGYSGQIRFLQARITAADGTVATDIYTIPAGSIDCIPAPDGGDTAVWGENAATPKGFLLFPNPASTHVTFDFNAQNDWPESIRLERGDGQVVAEVVLTDPVADLAWQMNVGALAPGVYFVKARYPDCQIVQKLIIQNR